jgi:hypothetical protein
MANKKENAEKERVHLVERLVFQPTKVAAFWCAGVLAAMHHGRFNASVRRTHLVRPARF